MISIPRNQTAADWHIKENNLSMDVPIPNHFRCPISLDLMKDPVTLSTGITYDRDSIEKWIQDGNNKCPITNQELTNSDFLIPNHTLRRMLQDWCVQNNRYGIQRIPTPRIPVTPLQVKDILSRFTNATRRSDQYGCSSLLNKIRLLCLESERNTKCFVTNGTATVLSAGFNVLASSSAPSNVEVLLNDILQLLVWMFPLDKEALSLLGSQASLRCMVGFLNCGDLSRMKNAVVVLREILSSDQQHVDAFAKIDEVDMLLLKLVKEPICHTATKASLIIISYLVTSEEITSRLVGKGLISMLLEILVSSEKSIYENALNILDGICDHPEGREKAFNHALTVPVLVKKVLRVSHLPNSLIVSILWKLCSNLKREEKGALVEALHLGVFQKLLLLLQIGCDDITKDRATKLLKLFNPYRASAECIDSTDFKALKRRF